ncbi:unnamed protein product [Candida verbasci]|uniref:Transmembrane protein n=1 Tax=Candida verbasci TaxID=1227364 RepID=A0A9W4XC32_9ASCO|nr:unnamed protein product [Candida verbasci]
MSAITNPLQRYLTPEQFDKCVSFYEADQKLNHNDRTIIASNLQKIGIISNFSGYTFGLLGFFAPTFYYRLITKGPPQPLFLLQRPILSFFIGFGSLIGSTNLLIKYLFEKQQSAKEFSDPNIENVYKLMDWKFLNAFTLYYARTSFNPMFIIRDPRLCTNESMIDQKKKHYSEVYGLGEKDQDGKHHELSMWDRIRLGHGGEISHDSAK